MEIFLKTTLPLEEVAGTIRRALNLTATNRTAHQVDQARYGLNLGGHYFLFETWGVELLLLANRGETEVPEMPDYPFYLLFHTPYDAAPLAKHLATVLESAGLESTVASYGV